MLEQSLTDGSAMATARRSQPNEGSIIGGQRQRKSNESQQKSNKDCLWCTYCKKPCHTKETCFKLHGKEYVLSHLGGFKDSQENKPTSLARK